MKSMKHVMKEARRKDRKAIVLSLARPSASPLDVPSIRADVTTKELVAIVREHRGRRAERASHILPIRPISPI